MTPHEFIERPPEKYRSGPTLTGKTTERLFDDLKALQQYCYDMGSVNVPPQRRQGERFAIACYVPATDEVVLPTKKAWNDKRDREKAAEHEWAHPRGWRHDLKTETGEGPPLTLEEILRLQAAYANRQAAPKGPIATAVLGPRSTAAR